MEQILTPSMSEPNPSPMPGGAFEAAALSIDIVGFTSLSEALMRESSANAEVLAEALDGFFGPIVSEIYSRGGVVPLFPGDGVLALFPASASLGPPSAGRVISHAVAAACFARNLFQNPRGGRSKRKTARHSLSLSARIGLSWGEVERGVLEVGGGARISHFRGCAVSRCALVQRAAGVGQVLIDEHILRRMDRVPPGTAVMGTPYHALACTGTRSPRARQGQGDGLTMVLPQLITERWPLAEFRDICPVFISFQEEDGPEMDAFMKDTAALVAEYGGHLNQIEFSNEGGMLVILFGAPVTHENMIERALGFLCSLGSEMRSVAWRAGVAFGRVWAGMRGGPERRAYGALGDVMNQAARLAFRAPWGEAWASDAVQHYVKPSFRLESLGTLSLRGRDQQAQVFRVCGRRDLDEAIVPRTGFVGREDELKQLSDCVAGMLQRETPGIVYVHGEAGIGKSRLVHELRDRLHSVLQISWLTCQVDQTLRHSLNPFSYMIRQYFRQEPDVPQSANLARFNRIHSELCDSLSDPRGEAIRAELRRTRSFLGALIGLRWEGSLYSQVDPQLRRDNTFMAVEAFLAAQSLQRPTIVQIEDAHWIDEDSQRLIQQVLTRAQGLPLVLLLTCRPIESGERLRIVDFEGIQEMHLELRPLAGETAVALARGVLEDEIAPALGEVLSQKCSGNPFFVEQMLLDLRERQALKLENGVWTICPTATDAVPPTIGAVLTARLDRLSADVRTIVQTASVLGCEFEITVLSRMLKNTEELPLRVGEAQRSRVWRPLSELRYIYLHALLRDAAYDMQVRSTLRTLHRLAGEAIAEVYADSLDTYYEDLAYHFCLAERPRRGATYTREAGSRAIERSAYREALRILSRGIQLLERAENAGLEPSRADLYRLRGTARQRLSEYADAGNDYARSMEISQRLNDLPRVAEAQNGLGFVSFSRGDYETARGCYERALELAEETESLKAAVLSNLGKLDIFQGNLQSGASYLEQGLGIQERAGDRTGSATSLLSLGTCAAYRGQHGDAVAYFQRSLGLSREAGNPQGVGASLNALGNMAYFAGDYAAAEGYFRESCAIMREIGDRRGLAATLNNLGGLHYSTCDFSAALADFDESLAIKREIGDRAGIADTLGNIGGTYSELGRFAESERYLAECIALKRSLSDRRGTAINLGNLASTKLGMDKDDEAAEALVEALSSAREIGAIPDMLFALVPAVKLMVRRGEVLQAATIGGQLARHERIHAQAKEVLESIRQRLCAGPEASALAQAWESRDEVDLDALVETVVRSLTERSRPTRSP